MTTRKISDNERKRILKKQYLSRQLRYYNLMSGGPHQFDIKNKKMVMEVQGVLKSSGHYKGELDGKWGPQSELARWQWVRDISKDPEFSWELIKQSGKEIFGGE